MNLFTKKWDNGFQQWCGQKKRWLKATGNIDRPFYYEDSLFIGKLGDWQIDEGLIDIPWETMEAGCTKNKTLGKIESYVMKYIRDIKQMIAKQVFTADDYWSRKYYEIEMQAPMVVLSACRKLKARNRKISDRNLTLIISQVKYTGQKVSNDAIILEDYFALHLDEVKEIVK